MLDQKPLIFKSRLANCTKEACLHDILRGEAFRATECGQLLLRNLPNTFPFILEKGTTTAVPLP